MPRILIKKFPLIEKAVTINLRCLTRIHTVQLLRKLKSNN